MSTGWVLERARTCQSVVADTDIKVVQVPPTSREHGLRPERECCSYCCSGCCCPGMMHMLKPYPPRCIVQGRYIDYSSRSTNKAVPGTRCHHHNSSSSLSSKPRPMNVQCVSLAGHQSRGPSSSSGRQISYIAGRTSKYRSQGTELWQLALQQQQSGSRGASSTSRSRILHCRHTTATRQGHGQQNSPLISHLCVRSCGCQALLQPRWHLQQPRATSLATQAYCCLRSDYGPWS